MKILRVFRRIYADRLRRTHGMRSSLESYRIGREHFLCIEAIGAGRADLYSGKDGHLIKTVICRIPGDTFGFDSVIMGDVDKDGTIDFLITSGWSGVHGFRSGRFSLFPVGQDQVTAINS